MIASRNAPYFTPEEYLQLELSSPVKHEYRRGTVTAMAGASTAHIAITRNIGGLFFNHLRGSDCAPYGGDAKVEIPGQKGYYYPDQVVTCDERDQRSNDGCMRHPQIIVEVLSDSTEAFDREGKFEDYKTILELKEYVLVHQKQMLVERFSRKGDNFWVTEAYRGGEQIHFESIDFICPIEFLYEGAQQAMRDAQ